MNYGLPAIGDTLVVKEKETTETTAAKSPADKTKVLNKMLADFEMYFTPEKKR